jgi:hypothetical protein
MGKLKGEGGHACTHAPTALDEVGWTSSRGVLQALQEWAGHQQQHQQLRSLRTLARARALPSAACKHAHNNLCVPLNCRNHPESSSTGCSCQLGGQVTPPAHASCTQQCRRAAGRTRPRVRQVRQHTHMHVNKQVGGWADEEGGISVS